MKKWLYTLPLVLAGCQVVEDVKEGVVSAPEDFWTSVREVLLFIWEILGGAIGSFLNGLLG